MRTQKLELCLDLCQRLLPVSQAANRNLSVWAGQQLDMIMLKAFQGPASYAVPFSPAKCSMVTEIHIGMKDIHWCLLASLSTFAFSYPVQLMSDFWDTEFSDSTISPYGRFIIILIQFFTKAFYWGKMRSKIICPEPYFTAKVSETSPISNIISF